MLKVKFVSYFPRISSIMNGSLDSQRLYLVFREVNHTLSKATKFKGAGLEIQ